MLSQQLKFGYKINNQVLMIRVVQKDGSTIKIDDTETEIGTRFPIKVVVCVSFSSSVGTKIDSKSKTARLLKSLLSSETGRLNPSSFSNKVS